MRNTWLIKKCRPWNSSYDYWVIGEQKPPRGEKPAAIFCHHDMVRIFPSLKDGRITKLCVKVTRTPHKHSKKLQVCRGSADCYGPICADTRTYWPMTYAMKWLNKICGLTKPQQTRDIYVSFRKVK